MTDDNINVIKLRPELDMTDEDRMLKIRPVPRSVDRGCYGHHQRFDLDHDTERVYCRDCGAEVPPFKALEGLARDVERYVNQRKEAARRAKVAEADLENLLKRERLAKSRVRNWTAKAPACECAFREKRLSWPWCPMCGGRR